MKKEELLLLNLLPCEGADLDLDEECSVRLVSLYVPDGLKYPVFAEVKPELSTIRLKPVKEEASYGPV